MNRNTGDESIMQYGTCKHKMQQDNACFALHCIALCLCCIVFTVLCVAHVALFGLLYCAVDGSDDPTGVVIYFYVLTEKHDGSWY